MYAFNGHLGRDLLRKDFGSLRYENMVSAAKGCSKV